MAWQRLAELFTHEVLKETKETQETLIELK
jgi:hypothetical protein